MNKTVKIPQYLPNLLTLIRLVLTIPLFCLLIATFFNVYGIKIDLNNLNGMDYRDVDNGYAINQTGIITMISLFIVFYSLAMITDFVDGYLARKYNLVSNFGKLWDPIADKVTTTIGLLFGAAIFTSFPLTDHGYPNNYSFQLIPLWLVAGFLIRDFIVSGFRALMSKHNIDVSAKLLGKIKTILMSAGTILTLIIGVSLYNSPETMAKMLLTDLMPLWIILINLPLIVALGFSIASGVQYFMAVKQFIKFK
ncbi:CDP-alcohol phosphatidyltransferase family protein [Mycoplasmopsis iners]|uniref:CDP-alcohol phosphatidyltransferase family protein n=1 Tax=Mycoplasmopsis iners TaxID=76630 RepID=UPI00068D6821|nr:CDP-alcohol phosphatidyltransferase family protein [Mycoplasmopsis iners]